MCTSTLSKYGRPWSNCSFRGSVIVWPSMTVWIFRVNTVTSLNVMLNSIAISTDAVSVPIVLLVLEGGPGTLETVHQAIQNNTPAVIVKVGRNKLCTYCTVISGGRTKIIRNCSPGNTIVKVGRNTLCCYIYKCSISTHCTADSWGRSRNPRNCSPGNTEQYSSRNS